MKRRVIKPNKRKMRPALVAVIALVILFIVFLVGVALNKAMDDSLSKNSEAFVSVDQPEVTEKSPARFEPISAKFAIFTNGFYRAFSSTMYHNRSKQVYISAPDTHVVIVKQEGTTWQDFFKTMPIKLDGQCLVAGTGERFCSGENVKLRLYLNGVADQNVLSKEISDNDELLITYGPGSTRQLEQELERVSDPSQ